MHNTDLRPQGGPSTGVRRRGRPLRKRVLLGCILALAAVVGLGLLMFPGREPDTQPPDGLSLEFVVTRPETTRPFAGGMLALSSAGYTWYNEKGSSAGFVSAPMREPMLLCGTSCFLCYESGGTALYTANPSKKLTTLQTQGAILHAALGGKDRFALVCDSAYHKGEVLVYGPDGESLFIFRAAEEHPYLCALSPDGGTLAVALLGYDTEGRVSTLVSCFDLSKGAETGRLTLSGASLSHMAFTGKNTLTLIGENVVVTADSRAAELSRYTLSSGSICAYALCGEQVVLYTRRQEAGHRFDLICVQDGRELSRLSTDREYTAIAAHDGHVALLSDRGADVYSSTLSPVLELHRPQLIGLYFTDDGRLCTLTAGGASLTRLS